MNLIKSVSFGNALLILLVLMVFSNCATENKVEDNSKRITMSEKQDIKPPMAKKVSHEMTLFGDTRNDNYYWMKLSDEQKNAGEPDQQTQEVLAFLNAENDYQKSMLSHTEKFQEKIYEEIVGRIKKDDSSVPYKDNGYYYITRYEEGKEQRIFTRKKGNLEADEELLLDENELAKPFDYYRIAGRSVSPNNKILAYGEDTLSRRIYTIKFKNLETGELLPDVIENTTGSIVWANDNKTVFLHSKR